MCLTKWLIGYKSAFKTKVVSTVHTYPHMWYLWRHHTSIFCCLTDTLHVVHHRCGDRLKAQLFLITPSEMIWRDDRNFLLHNWHENKKNYLSNVKQGLRRSLIHCRFEGESLTPEFRSNSFKYWMSDIMLHVNKLAVHVFAHVFSVTNKRVFHKYSIERMCFQTRHFSKPKWFIWTSWGCFTIKAKPCASKPFHIVGFSSLKLRLGGIYLITQSRRRGSLSFEQYMEHPIHYYRMIGWLRKP